jgi:hypothetical protein
MDGKLLEPSSPKEKEKEKERIQIILVKVESLNTKNVLGNVLVI